MDKHPERDPVEQKQQKTLAMKLTEYVKLPQAKNASATPSKAGVFSQSNNTDNGGQSALTNSSVTPPQKK